MKSFFVFVLFFGMTLTASFANDIKPTKKCDVTVRHNGFNYLEVSLDKDADDVVRVTIFSNDFALVHRSKAFKAKSSRTFNIAQLEKGYYIVKVEVNGVYVYTEAIEVLK